LRYRYDRRGQRCSRFSNANTDSNYYRNRNRNADWDTRG
jgi:hypothetical protein